MPRRAIIAETGAVLVEEMETALTGWQRFRGLMLRKGLGEGEGLLFPDVSSIHMCFMRFAIDVIYLDGQNRVVKIVERLKPWRLSACWQASSTLETEPGRAAECGLEVGHHLRFESAATTPPP